MIDAAKPRRLLLVTYWYPPAVGAAAERMHSFAKYLPEHGWEVRVLTAKVGNIAVNDPHVTAAVDPWRRPEGPIANYNPYARGTWSTRLRGLMREFVFPDRFKRWQEAAFHEGVLLIGAWRPDLILASFPPASAVQLAVRLHKATGVPMVLDYRDKWLGPGGYEPRFKRTIRKHVLLEYDGLMPSAGVTAVSEALIADLVDDAKYQHGRTAVIYNGFEPYSALPTVQPQSRSDTRPLIAHVGTVIPRNKPELFFKSLYRLIADALKGNEDADVFRAFQYLFVGNLDPQFLEDTLITGLCTTTGMVSRDSARAEMFNADALLLLTGDYVAKWGYSVKLFEYLQTGRPILCFEESPGSNDARLLRELAPDRSFIGRLGDKESLSEQLIRLRDHLKNEARTPVMIASSLALARFSRANQAAELARFLHRITKS